MVYPPQYFIKTKSFIKNLIEEGRVDEANQLLELSSKELVQSSNTESEIGPSIASDLSELERRSGDSSINKRNCFKSWRQFKVSCILYYFLLIITIFYLYRNHFILTLLSLCAFDIDKSQETNSQNEH